MELGIKKISEILLANVKCACGQGTISTKAPGNSNLLFQVNP